MKPHTLKIKNSLRQLKTAANILTKYSIPTKDVYTAIHAVNAALYQSIRDDVNGYISKLHPNFATNNPETYICDLRNIIN